MVGQGIWCVVELRERNKSKLTGGMEIMQYAIELYFDKKIEEKIYLLANQIADAGISTKYLEWKTRPHITLACFNDVDEKECINKLKVFAQHHKKQFASLASVGMFVDTKTIYLAPVMTSSMYQFQKELHDLFSEFDTKGSEWYMPNRWVPHCTIALTKDDKEDTFFKASDLVLHQFEKMFGEFTSIGLVKISFPVEEIFTIDLNG